MSGRGGLVAGRLALALLAVAGVVAAGLLGYVAGSLWGEHGGEELYVFSYGYCLYGDHVVCSGSLVFERDGYTYIVLLNSTGRPLEYDVVVNVYRWGDLSKPLCTAQEPIKVPMRTGGQNPLRPAVLALVYSSRDHTVYVYYSPEPADTREVARYPSIHSYIEERTTLLAAVRICGGASEAPK